MDSVFLPLFKRIRRPGIVWLLLLFSGASLAEDPAAPIGSASATSAEVVFDSVVAQAKSLAKNPFVPAKSVPTPLAELNFDQYRAIRFRRDKAIWKDQGLFEIQPLHAGFLYRDPVAINLIDNSGSRRQLEFSPQQYHYEGKTLDPALLTPDLGYAGFRVHYPLNRDDYKDEVLVFQGASYFRMVGPGQVYGISARGLAINTADGAGEEFPAFREFWLIQGGENEDHLTLIALLDSPSVAGAYRFDLFPGSATELRVQAQLFARTDVKKLGIAPLTSMFHHGENRNRYVDDFRPEVHDSDGVLMKTSGSEWIWRPLSNPRKLRVVSFQDENPKGFGLMQRDRDFDHYLDLDLQYERRPSLWVEPVGDWGKGRLELVEIPTQSETNDNIVSYWVPDQPFKAGQSRQFEYRLYSLEDGPTQNELATVLRSRIGRANFHDGEQQNPSAARYVVVDFSGTALENLGEELPIKAQLSLSSGKYRDVRVEPLPAKGQWRVAFRMQPSEGAPVDMRLYLSWRGQRLSEVWNYVWYPDDVQ